MATCDVCGRQESMPYNCRHCGGTFCPEHRLPENHDCPGLQNWNDPSGVFDSGFDDSVDSRGGASASSRVASKLPFDTGAGGPLSYFRGNVAYTFLALMWVTYVVQALVLAFASGDLHDTLFVLRTQHPEYVWTWVTSIFAHAPFPSFYHIVGNSFVVFFFGPLVERYVGSRRFAILFVVSGALAGLGQIAIQILQSPGIPVGGVLGASGAGLAIMGVLTVLRPDLKVYLYFLLPVPIWLLTAGYALLSITALSGGTGGTIAHGAHLIGLAIGLGYGEYVKRTQNVHVPNQFQLGGGGPGGPGGPGRGRGPF